MNSKTKSLILRAVSSCGRSNVNEVMSFMFEQLTEKEAKDIRLFLKWAFSNWSIRMFGHGNIEKRWQQWLNSKINKSSKIKAPKAEEKYPRSDWIYEVKNGDTILGYKEWVKHRKESDKV